MFIFPTTARSFMPTHQPISKEKQTQIPNTCQDLSQIRSFIFLFRQLDFHSTLPSCILGSTSACILAIITQDTDHLLTSEMICSSSVLLKYQSSFGLQRSSLHVRNPPLLRPGLQNSKLSKLKVVDFPKQSHLNSSYSATKCLTFTRLKNQQTEADKRNR